MDRSAGLGGTYQRCALPVVVAGSVCGRADHAMLAWARTMESMETLCHRLRLHLGLFDVDVLLLGCQCAY